MPLSPSPETVTSVHQRSPLLALPVELRERVYSYLLASPAFVQWPLDLNRDRVNDIHAAILRTNRQINAEATALLYRLNRFCFDHPSDCNVFKHTYPGASSVTQVAFQTVDRDVPMWEEYIKSLTPHRSLAQDLPSLKYLYIYMKQSAWSPSLSAEENYKHWINNARLGRVIASVQNLPALARDLRVTIISHQRLHPTHLGAVRAAFPDDMAVSGEGLLRVKEEKFHQQPTDVSVILELATPGASPSWLELWQFQDKPPT